MGQNKEQNQQSVNSPLLRHSEQEERAVEAGKMLLAKRMFGVNDLRNKVFWRDVGSELFATSLLVAVQCALPMQFVDSDDEIDWAILTKIALGMGFVVTCMIETFGEMGGAHMNPAVSISLTVAGNMCILKGFFYIVAQCTGATLGALFAYSMSPPEYRGNLAVTTTDSQLPPWKGMMVELWLTCMLVLTIWGSTDSQRKKVYMPSIPIGLAVAMCIMTGGLHSGSSLNPARSLGPAIVMNKWDHHWVYWAGPIAGGLLATFMYKIVYSPFDNDEDKFEHVDQVRQHDLLVEAVKAAMNGRTVRRARNEAVCMVDMDIESDYPHDCDSEPIKRCNHAGTDDEEDTKLRGPTNYETSRQRIPERPSQKKKILNTKL